MVTPTSESGVIDVRNLRKLADRQVDAGVSGLVLFGSTGAVGSL